MLMDIKMIRNERTPKGDGKQTKCLRLYYLILLIRNERTPKGDGKLIPVADNEPLPDKK